MNEERDRTELRNLVNANNKEWRRKYKAQELDSDDEPLLAVRDLRIVSKGDEPLTGVELLHAALGLSPPVPFLASGKCSVLWVFTDGDADSEPVADKRVVPVRWEQKDELYPQEFDVVWVHSGETWFQITGARDKATGDQLELTRAVIQVIEAIQSPGTETAEETFNRSGLDSPSWTVAVSEWIRGAT